MRCFLAKETKRGIQLAQSSSPSCHSDLRSSLSGHRTFKLKRRKTAAAAGGAAEDDLAGSGGVEEADVLPNCYYPGWAALMHTLYSFSQASKYQFLEEGRVLSVSNFSAASGRSHELSRTQCVSVEEETEDYMKMVAVTLAGCEERFKCVRLFRRTNSIIEIQVNIFIFFALFLHLRDILKIHFCKP